MIKTIINGCNGTMGQVLSEQILLNEEFEVVAGIDMNKDRLINTYEVYKSLDQYNGKADVIIDFSNPVFLDNLLSYGLEKKVALVIATTGLSDEHIENINLASKKIPILYSYNMSLGINIISNVLKQISSALKENFDIEIIEKHHNKKVDAPSGTAYLLANSINEGVGNNLNYVFGRSGLDEKREENELGIHSIRGGTIAGEHTVIFAGNDEVIEFKHTALSKNVFAIGAIKAAEFLISKEKGLYTMNDILTMRG